MKNNISVFNEGDLVIIPLPSGDSALGRIVYISGYFRDAVGVVIYCLGDNVDDLLKLEHTASSPMIGPIYTNIKAASHYGWKVLRHEKLSVLDQMLTKRIVGGEIWIGDQLVGPATREDEQVLPRMLAFGMPGIYREIEKAFKS